MADVKIYVHNPKNDYMKLKEPDVGVVKPPTQPLPKYRIYNHDETQAQYNRIEQDAFESNEKRRKKMLNRGFMVSIAFASVMALSAFLFIRDYTKLLTKLLSEETQEFMDLKLLR